MPSKWVYNHHKVWQASLESMGFSKDHFIHSTKARSGDEQEVEIDKCLGQPSLSTLGLVLVMARLVGCSAQSGGLRDLVARPAVAALLKGLPASCRRLRSLRMSVLVVDSWAPSWPCTEPSHAGALLLDLDEHLEVDLAPLVQFQRDPVAGHLAQRWVKQLNLDCPPDASVKLQLDDLILKVVSVSGLVALAAQPFWYIAQWVELCVWHSLRRGQSHRLAIKVSYADAEAALRVPHRFDAMILRHVVASIEATRGHTHLSLAVDKAKVGGIQLQVGVFVLGDNRSMMACPQVVVGRV